MPGTGMPGTGMPGTGTPGAPANETENASTLMELTIYGIATLVALWHGWLRPGGLVMVANMNDSKPFRNFIEFVLDWQLIYRDSNEMRSFIPEAARDQAQVVVEDTTVNLFLHVRQPD